MLDIIIIVLAYFKQLKLYYGTSHLVLNMHVVITVKN